MEDLPWKLWEVFFAQLNAIDRLHYVTSSKAMMMRYQERSNLAELRRQAREAVQEAREEEYAQRVKTALDHYIAYNIHLRQRGVEYRYVARNFRAGRQDLQEGVEACFEPYEDDDLDWP